MEFERIRKSKDYFKSHTPWYAMWGKPFVDRKPYWTTAVQRTAILLVPVALFLSACSGGSNGATPEPTLPPVQDVTHVVAEGRVEPVRFADLALNASGEVSEVLVVEGEQVSPGQVLARLESAEVQSLEDAQAAASLELTSAHQALRDAQFELDDFDVPVKFAGMAPAEAAQSTLETLDAARDAFEPYKHLSDKRLELSDAERKQDTFETYRDTAKLYKSRLDDAWADHRKAILWLELESNLIAAEARLDKAQRDFDSLQDPSFAEETAGLRGALADAELRAPFAGVITRLDLKLGESATAGSPVVTLADLSSWVVKTTDLTEIDVVSIEPGQPVTIVLDALPDTPMSGNVFSIGEGFSEQQGDIVYEVTILLTDQDPAMRWGMTAELTFDE